MGCSEPIGTASLWDEFKKLNRGEWSEILSAGRACLGKGTFTSAYLKAASWFTLRGASLELHRQPEIWVSHVTKRDTGTLMLGCVVQCTCRPTWAFVCSSADGWGIPAACRTLGHLGLGTVSLSRTRNSVLAETDPYNFRRKNKRLKHNFYRLKNSSAVKKPNLFPVHKDVLYLLAQLRPGRISLFLWGLRKFYFHLEKRDGKWDSFFF